MSNLTKTTTAVDQLNKSLAKSSLDDLVKARGRRSLLLVDCSSSMGLSIASGERRVDAMRRVVATLLETHPVPVAAFNSRRGCGANVRVVDQIPEPHGDTPLHSAIDFCRDETANHIVLVTDGEPASEYAAFEAAAQFGGVIDVFYIGDGNDRGARFCQELAQRTGGTANVTDLGKPKELAAKIAGFLPEAC